MSGFKAGLEPELCGIPSFGELFHKSLLVVSPPLSIPDRLRAIFEREFDVVSIIQASQFDAILSMDRPPARTIFLSADYLDIFDSIKIRLDRLNIDLNFAVLYDERFRSNRFLSSIISDRKCSIAIPINDSSDSLVPILRIAKSGGEYIPPSLLREFFLGRRDKINRHHSNGKAADQAGVAESAKPRELKGLTGREMQILEMVAHGYRNRTIAEELNLSEHTVKVHLRNIIKKLGAYNRTSAAAKYFAGAVDSQN